MEITPHFKLLSINYAIYIKDVCMKAVYTFIITIQQVYTIIAYAYNVVYV